MGKPLTPIYDAFGGLHTEGEETTRPPGTALTCTNFRAGKGGKTLKKMHGGSRYVSGQVGSVSKPILGATAFTDKQGIIHEIVRTPDGYYEHDLDGAAWTIKKSTNQEDDGYPSWASTQGILFIVDGYSAYKYDGTTFSTWNRLSAPIEGLVTGATPRPTVTLSGGGSLTADAEYEAFYTFVDSSARTKESPPSGFLRFKTTDANLTATINTGYAGRFLSGGTSNFADTTTSLFHLPSDVAGLSANARLHAYVSKADNPGAWWRAGSAAIARSAAEETVAIAAESTSNKFANYFGPPARATGVTLHHSRLWVWGSPGYPTRLWFTELDVAGTFKANAFLDIAVDQPDDPIKACIPFGEGGGAELLVLKLNSVWRITGNDFATFVAQLVKTGPSCLSDRSVAISADGAVYWSGHEACYRYSGGEVQTITDGKIRDTWRSATGLVDVS